MGERHVLHYIDNTSALSSLVRGYSPKADSALIVQAFWAIATSLGASVWFEFVRSEANVADMPSRDDFAFLHERLHRLIPGSAKAVRRT